MELILTDKQSITLDGLNENVKDKKKIHTKKTFYDFTTEYLNLTIDNLLKFFPKQIKGDILTIDGSGDQLTHFAYANPKSIDSIDHSAVACFYTELKKMALENLQQVDFLSFFSIKDLIEIPDWAQRYYEEKPKLDYNLSFSKKIYQNDY